MNKTLLVAAREYFENLSTKTFWIGILVFPIILVASLVVPTLLERSKSARTYTVVDQSGWLHDDVMAQVRQKDFTIVFERLLQKGDSLLANLPDGLKPIADSLSEENLTSMAAQLAGSESPNHPLIQPEIQARMQDWWSNLTQSQASAISDRLSHNSYLFTPPSGDETKLNQALNDEDLFAYFNIQPDPLNDVPAMDYVSNNFTDEGLKYWYSGFADQALKRKRIHMFDIDPEVARKLTSMLVVKSKKVTKAGEESEVETVDQVHQWVPVAFVYLLWLSVFSISQMLLTNTVEEKSNRIIEVLLSSVSPLQLMSGKIFGIAATGLTIILSWIVFFFFALKGLPLLLGMPLGFDLTFVVSDFRYLGSFVAYFMFGYFFYAALLVGMGSVCNSLKEAQNLMTPVILILLVPMFAMVPVGQDPNGTLAKLMSYFPPFTPFIMMNRAAGPPAWWEYALTTALMLISIGIVFWASAKVFRIGILLTGKPPKLREILRWIKAPVGVVPQRKTND